MKLKIFIRTLVTILLLVVVLGACSRESITVGDLQGTWVTDCINDRTGSYKTTVVFSGNSFQFFDTEFAQTACAGNVTNANPYVGTYNLTGNQMDWIYTTQRNYDVLELSPDKRTLKFSAKAGLTPESRPSAVSPREYHKQ